MRKLILFCCGLLPAFVMLQAQEGPSFHVEVSTDSILLGNYFSTTFVLENAQGNDFNFPEFRDFTIVGGPNFSSSTQIVNGEMSQRISYTFFLEPRDVGEFYIEPASVESNGEVFETLPLAVRVAPNPDGIIQRPEQSQGNADFWGDDFFDDFFRRDFGFPEFSQPPSLPQDSTRQAPRKRKTTRI